MKKRLTLFAICLALISVAILVTAYILDRRASPYFSSPDDVRANAFSEFDDFFTNLPDPIPDLSTAPSLPRFSIDGSKEGKVVVSWRQEEMIDNIAAFGDRIPADPSTQSFELPNGQVIRLVGIAHSPGLKKLFDRDDPDRWGQRGKITWYDPVSMKPIADPESVGLEKEADIGERQSLFFAFQCSDAEGSPVRWHWLRVHDERTKALVANSSSRQKNDKGIVIYKHNLKIFHNTPLHLLLPISYGETEVKEADLTEPEDEVRFGGDAVEISILATRAGQKFSTSHSGGGSTMDAMLTFQYRDPKPDKDWNQSFSLVSVWPKVQGNHLQYLDSKGEIWQDFHPNNIVNAVTHNQKLADLGMQKWRRFPEQARGVFELKGIPELPDLDNLFLAEIGPIRLDYDNYFRDAIAGPTLLDWSFNETSIDRSEFPITFDDPTVTPAQLLAEYEKRIGMKLEVNQTNHQISGEKDPWRVRLKNWWEKTRMRIFP